MIRLSGAEVVLRDWTAADVEPYAGWLEPGNRWQETNAPYFPRPTAGERDEQVRRIAALATGDLPEPRESLAVADPVSDTLVGTVTWYWESLATDWRRMGILLFDPAWWGRGAGTDAMRLWTTYLFERTPALRLDFATYSGNPGMMAVGRKLGFTEEGRFRKARPYAGEVHDSVVYGILREEWHG